MQFKISLFIAVFLTVSYAQTNQANELTEPPLGLALFNTNQQASQAIQVATHANIKISGLTARVKLSQEFKNDSNEWVNGTYFFPLPEKSAVDGLKIRIGERVIEGVIKEKQEAKRIFNRALKAGKKASLVEQHRPNVFSNQIANIPPLATIKVEISYQQDIHYQHDSGMKIVLPMTMTPRYTPQSKIIENYQSNEFSSQQQFSFPVSVNSVDLDPELNQRNSMTLDINLDAGFEMAEVSSPSHQITKQQLTQTTYLIRLNGDYQADRDFILNWKPQSQNYPKAAVFQEQLDQSDYLSIMLLPPSQSEASQSLPREVSFVIDTSGSMGGESIRQAKQALLYALSTLSRNDYFNIIEFNSDFSELFNGSKQATPSNIALAQRFVINLSAGGGTNMFKPVASALQSSVSEKLVKQVVFLTDGAISNEAELFSMIKAHIGHARLFPVGIGSAPNEFFMRRAAQFGRGKATFIASIAESKEKLENLFKHISRPLLTNLQVHWPDNLTVEMWPHKIPDLHSGDPLWIKAKVVRSEANGLSEQANYTVRVSGDLPTQQWEANLAITPTLSGNTATRLANNSGLASKSGIAKLWAREKIAALMNAASHGKVSAKTRQLITELGIDYQLVTRFTSLVAVEKQPSRAAGEGVSPAAIPSLAPKGSLRYPRTGISLWASPRVMLFGLIGLIIIGLAHKLLLSVSGAYRKFNRH
ncbi:marine proteobacterial sortase target protein [Aliikangiella sp. IMCC44653]